MLAHTYNPRAIAGARLNGTTTGEAGLNALVAQHFAVPIAVITGDRYVGREAAPFCPGLVHVPVKESVSRYAARHPHPEEAPGSAPRRSPQCTVSCGQGPAAEHIVAWEVDLASPDMAEQVTWLRGVSRVDNRTITVTDDDPLRLFGTFVTLVYLTRALVESR